MATCAAETYPHEFSNKYTSLTRIGEGTYGVVYKAFDKEKNSLVAIKKVRLEAEDEGVPATTVREIATLRELEHPNIVLLQEIIVEKKRLYLVFEFVKMDLKRYLESLPRGHYLDIITLKSYWYQILQAICYCHQRRIIHRDLKPQNLLVNGEGTIKLADFGLARVIGIPMRAYTHEIVTLWYRAPELLLGCPRYTMGVDMWSIGCIFAEMAIRKPLFPGDCEIDELFQIFKILTTPTEEMWKGVTSLPDFKPSFPHWREDTLDERLRERLDPDGIKLIRGLLAYNPGKRTAAKVLLRDLYFSDLDRKKLPAGDWDGVLIINKRTRPRFID